MTGAKGSNNPWRDLAAEILNRALEDYREIGPIDANRTRLGLRRSATNWMREDEGHCQYLLGCLLNISNKTLLERCCCEYVREYYWYRADRFWCPEHKYQSM